MSQLCATTTLLARFTLINSTSVFLLCQSGCRATFPLRVARSFVVPCVLLYTMCVVETLFALGFAGSTINGAVFSDAFADVAPPARDNAEVNIAGEEWCFLECLGKLERFTK